MTKESLDYQKTKEAANLRSIVINDPYQVMRKRYGKDYETYRRQWLAAGERTYLSDAPLHLDIDISDACNLSCQYCPQNVYAGWTGKLMDGAIFEKILNEAEKEKIPSVNIGWNAEPLVNKKIFFGALDILDRHKVMDVFLHTNAVSLSPDVQERIIQSQVKTVCFSLGGVEDRGKNLKMIIKNIIDFKELRHKLAEELPIIRIGIIPTDDNLDKVPSYLNFWKKYADYIELQDVTLVSGKIGETYHKKKVECNNPWRRLSINSSGDIYPCCGFTVFSRDLKLGNIKNDSLKKCWQLKRVAELRRALKTNELGSYPGCARCLSSLYSATI